MKKNTGFIISRIAFGAWLVLLSFVSFAQDDKKIDVNIDVNKHYWYQQPWVWIVGGAVFILLLAAILRGGRRTTY